MKSDFERSSSGDRADGWASCRAHHGSTENENEIDTATRGERAATARAMLTARTVTGNDDGHARGAQALLVHQGIGGESEKENLSMEVGVRRIAQRGRIASDERGVIGIGIGIGIETGETGIGIEMGVRGTIDGIAKETV